MCMGAILYQDDAVRATVCGDLFDLERDVSADMNQECQARPMLVGLPFEVGERHAEIRTVAIHELDAGSGMKSRERRRHADGE